MKNQSAEESSYDGFGTEHACAQMIFRLQRAPAAAADIGDILPSRPALRSVTNNVPIQDPEPCRIGSVHDSVVVTAVIDRSWYLALGRSVLSKHTARAPFRDAQCNPYILYRGATESGTKHLPFKTSIK